MALAFVIVWQDISVRYVLYGMGAVVALFVLWFCVAFWASDEPD